MNVAEHLTDTSAPHSTAALLERVPFVHFQTPGLTFIEAARLDAELGALTIHTDLEGPWEAAERVFGGAW